MAHNSAVLQETSISDKRGHAEVSPGFATPIGIVLSSTSSTRCTHDARHCSPAKFWAFAQVQLPEVMTFCTE